MNRIIRIISVNLDAYHSCKNMCNTGHYRVSFDFVAMDQLDYHIVDCLNCIDSTNQQELIELK